MFDTAEGRAKQCAFVNGRKKSRNFILWRGRRRWSSHIIS
jgi:hypothetical protein